MPKCKFSVKEPPMQKHDRSNTYLELIIRYGIVLDREIGAVHAWTFMANNGVIEPVIVRVLSEPRHRREEDRSLLDIATKCEHLQGRAKGTLIASPHRLNRHEATTLDR